MFRFNFWLQHCQGAPSTTGKRTYRSVSVFFTITSLSWPAFAQDVLTVARPPIHRYHFCFASATSYQKIVTNRSSSDPGELESENQTRFSFSVHSDVGSF